MEANPLDGHLSDPFLDRVRRSYQLALNASDDYRGRMWAEIDQRRAPIHAALVADNNDALRTIFANPAATELFLGVDYLRHELSAPQPNALVAGSIIGNRPVKEHLEDAARRLFVLLPKSQQDSPPPFPNPFPNEIGLQTSTGIASYHAVQAVHYASLIQAALLSCRTKSVIEIGPGIGRTAYYAHHLGITDYTTIDLPLGMAAQACFLGAALGPDKIWMYADGGSKPAGRIKLLAAGAEPGEKYGVAFNADSLTEMSLRAAMNYARWLRQHCECFVSVNRSDNLFTVKDIASKWFKVGDRRPYRMDTNYDEEVFVPKRFSTLTAWHRIGWHIMKLVGQRGPKRAVNSLRQRIQSRLYRLAARNT